MWSVVRGGFRGAYNAKIKKRKRTKVEVKPTTTSDYTSENKEV